VVDDAVTQLVFMCSVLSLTRTWSQPFAKHFVDNIHPSIDHLGAWILRPYGLESATTNQSETFNYVLKRLQEWKDAPVDAMALSLFRLSQYHLVEIKRGLCGQGEYHLRVGVEACVTTILPPVVGHPNDIVESIRQGSASAHGISSDNDGSSDTSDDVSMPPTSTSSTATGDSTPSSSGTSEAVNMPVALDVVLVGSNQCHCTSQ